jgi:hypothetical protein
MDNKIKILLSVRGGVIQEIHSNQDPENVEIVIVDWDNVDVGESAIHPVEPIHNPKSKFENAWELYTDEDDVAEMEVREDLKRLKF